MVIDILNYSLTICKCGRSHFINFPEDKKVSYRESKKVTKFFEIYHNKKLNLYESPMNESFALDIKSSNEISLVGGKDLMDVLSEEDLKKLQKMVSLYLTIKKRH